MGKQEIQIVSTAMLRHCQIFQYLIKNRILTFGFLLYSTKSLGGIFKVRTQWGEVKKGPKNAVILKVSLIPLVKKYGDMNMPKYVYHRDRIKKNPIN